LIVKNTPLLSRQSCKNLGSYQDFSIYLVRTGIWFGSPMAESTGAIALIS
jgi:hypothetical protein